MDFRAIVKSILREELSHTSSPTTKPPSAAPAVPERASILARLNDLKGKMCALDARKADMVADEARIADLEIELAELRERVRANTSRLWCEWIENSAAIDKQLALLRTTCSAQLDKFIESMNAEHTELVKLIPKTHIGFGDKNLFADNPKTPRLRFSNAPAISRRAGAVLAARSRAEELKYLDRTEDELRQELEGLQAALPSIDHSELVIA
ncbi:MAG TPA: hypothetical protein DEA71_09805 [Nitrospira sp.]|nr:hypothetical protein [Nitrospira sp.]